MNDFDMAIIGAGIAGASLAHALVQRRSGLRLVLLEAESTPGYHTTGRSAAFFAELYGGPLVQPLSSASRAFLESPPGKFSETGFLSSRGAIHIAPPGESNLLEPLAAEFSAHSIPRTILQTADIHGYVPQLMLPWASKAIYEPGCSDIDVAALHQAYLRSARQAGAPLVTDARVTQLQRVGGGWRIDTAAGEFKAAHIVNAAGAWADEIAHIAGIPPVGLVPMRRTIVVAEVDPQAPADMPLVMDVKGSFYFRPDGYRLWLSPHDETPDVAHDVQPEELDIAITLDRFEHICDWPVRRIASRWAGLRTFAPDRLPVLGPDPSEPTFIWCAGQGGWGIQTAPAVSDLLAAILLGESPPMDPAPYLPSRFR